MSPHLLLILLYIIVKLERNQIILLFMGLKYVCAYKKINPVLHKEENKCTDLEI